MSVHTSMYYGRIGSEATERLLERFGHDGSFLLRDSETMQGAYCLCVREHQKGHSLWCQDTPPHRPTGQSTATVLQLWRRYDTHTHTLTFTLYVRI
uniref:SH2 domain-containing protein n=1 Tax=Seriola lalandi dorsalis TaxID=1841481 RepID=A0A3B4WMX8_SERLL